MVGSSLRICFLDIFRLIDSKVQRVELCGRHFLMVCGRDSLDGMVQLVDLVDREFDFR